MTNTFALIYSAPILQVCEGGIITSDLSSTVKKVSVSCVLLLRGPNKREPKRTLARIEMVLQEEGLYVVSGRVNASDSGSEGIPWNRIDTKNASYHMMQNLCSSSNELKLCTTYNNACHVLGIQ